MMFDFASVFVVLFAVINYHDVKMLIISPPHIIIRSFALNPRRLASYFRFSVVYIDKRNWQHNYLSIRNKCMRGGCKQNV